MPEGQISLKGAIEPGVLAEVLQFICGRHDRAGYLRVGNQHVSGRIWCREGSIVAAECGTSRDIPAIRRILCMKSGEFAFVDTTTQTERTLFDDVTTILLESFRQIDETQEIEPLEPEPVVDTSLHRPAAPWAQQGGGSAPQPSAAPAAGTVAPAAGTGTRLPSGPPSGGYAPRPALSAAYTTARPAPPPRRRFPRWAAWCLLLAGVTTLLGAGAWFWYGRRPAAESEGATAIPSTKVSFGTRLSGLWQGWFPARTAPAPAPEPEPEPVTWPVIRLSGIIAAPGQKASAIINGRMFLEGDAVEGVRLETVTRTGIVLRSGTHTRFVSETTIGDPQEDNALTNAPAATTTNTFQRYYPGVRQWVKQWFSSKP